MRAVHYRQSRDALHLTRRQIARLAGVSSVAVAAYERGIWQPKGRAAELYRVIAEALVIPATTLAIGRGRTVTVPSARWNHYLPVDGEVRLPIHLDWSPRHQRVWRLSDEAVRGSFYAIVLTEGTVVDICVYLDPSEIVRLWSNLASARPMSTAVTFLAKMLAVDHLPTGVTKTTVDSAELPVVPLNGTR